MLYLLLIREEKLGKNRGFYLPFRDRALQMGAIMPTYTQSDKTRDAFLRRC